MKIIHTSDWHLGKHLYNYSLLKEQAYLLFEQLLPTMQKKACDVLIISGDVFDRANPSNEAIKLFDDFLRTAKEKMPDLKIMIIAGNHDSPEKIEYAKEFFARGLVFTKGEFENETNPVVLSDEYGEIAFYLVPFFYPQSVDFPQTEQDSKPTNLERIIYYYNKLAEHATQNYERSVIITHTMAGKNPFKEQIEGEREIRFFTDELVPVDVFKPFSYAALGHIHKVYNYSENETVRYSGALMTFDFAEVEEDKNRKRGVWFIELEADGLSHSEFIVLEPKREMYVLNDSLENLLSEQKYDDKKEHLLLINASGKYDPEMSAKLRSRFPFLLHETFKQFSIKPKSSYNLDIEENFTPKELFEQYWRFVRGDDDEYLEEAIDLFAKLLDEVTKGDS